MLRRNNKLVKKRCSDCEGPHKKNKKNKNKKERSDKKKNKGQDVDDLIASVSTPQITFETLSQRWNKTKSKPKAKSTNGAILNTRRVPLRAPLREIPVNRPSLRNNNISSTLPNTKAQYIVVNKPGCLFCP